MLPLMKTNVTFYERAIRGFGGINVCEDHKNGELYMSENMTSLLYPSLSSRKDRKEIFRTERTINGIGGFEGFFYTSHTDDGKRIFLTFNGVDYEFTSLSASDDFTKKREFAALTNTILIIPDNVIFSATNKTLTKASFSYTQDTATAKKKFKTETNGMNTIENETIDRIATLESGRIYAKRRDYTYSGTKTFYYCKFPDTLKKGDVIELKANVYASSHDGDDGYYDFIAGFYKGLKLKIKDVKTVSHSTPSGTVKEIVELVFDTGAINMSKYQSLNVVDFTINRTMPKLSHICSFGNRVWGIGGKYIYASKLSDASEWNDFTVDEYGTLPYASFSSAAQTDGNFTAITPYGNYIYAFKENAIHKIFGDNPDEYTLHTEKCRGVGDDMAGCLSVSASSIIYASSDGIYVYRGDYPKKISENIGVLPRVISGAASEEFYYILCSDENTKFLYVYDIARHIWHKESAPSDSTMLYCYGNKVCLAAGGTLLCLNEDGGKPEKGIKWNFSLLIDDKLIEKKGYGKISLKYSLDKNASFTVRAIYDDGGKGAVCGARYDEADGASASLFLPVKRCNWFKLEFSGVGGFILKAVNLKFYRGSDI